MHLQLILSFRSQSYFPLVGLQSWSLWRDANSIREQNLAVLFWRKFFSCQKQFIFEGCWVFEAISTFSRRCFLCNFRYFYNFLSSWLLFLWVVFVHFWPWRNSFRREAICIQWLLYFKSIPNFNKGPLSAK